MAGIPETRCMWSSLRTVVHYVRRHPPSRLMVYGLLVGVLSLQELVKAYHLAILRLTGE